MRKLWLAGKQPSPGGLDAACGDPPTSTTGTRTFTRPPADVRMTLDVSDNYSIHVGPITADSFSILHERKYAGWVIFVDTNTRQLCLPLLEPFLTHPNIRIVEAPAGELNKHLGTCEALWKELFAGRIGRRWCAICLGGGVLADMAGFVASTYKRGIDFLQVPTTLLSQVDSSVGGKLGVDFNGLKNSIGLFRNPIAVWIDPIFLRTLPEREVRSGYGEVIKHALIADAEQWAHLRQLADLSVQDWSTIIPQSVNIKRHVVEQDPFEQGARKALNFGHTIGHAIESWFLDGPERMFHGEAIAAGMVMESWLSTRLAGLSETDLGEIQRYVLAVYGHQSIPEDAIPALLELMTQDKKNEGTRINFTLLRAPGMAVVNQTADAALIEQAIAYYNSLPAG